MKKVKFTIAAILISVIPVAAHLNIGGIPYGLTKGNMLSFIENQIPVLQLPEPDLNTLVAEDAIREQNGRPPRFGYKHFVSKNLNNSGYWYTLSTGDRV